MKAVCRSWSSLFNRVLCLTFAVSAAPTWAATSPVFLNPKLLPNGQLQIQMATEVGQSYTFEISTNLVTWQPVGSVPNVDTNLLTLVDDTPVTASPCRFYRAKVGLTKIYSMWFSHQVQPGRFGTALTPTVSYPASIWAYTASFEMENDAPYPDPGEVFFSGPPGSGLNHTAANPQNSWVNDETATYQSPLVSNPPLPPGGEWTVQYKGSNYVFNLPDPQSASRLVIPVPTFVVSGDIVQSVSWVYRDPATGVALSAPPDFMTGIQVQIEGYVGGRIYESPWSDFPAVTNHTLQTTIQWSNVSMVNMAYDDSLGNHYVIFFQK
jgi:hypothetical protein